MLKVLYINASDGKGGAGIGGYRSFSWIKKYSQSISIEMLVRNKYSLDPFVKEVVLSPRSCLYLAKNKVSNILKISKLSSCLQYLEKAPYSTAHIPVLTNKFFNRSNYDILNFHWIGNRITTIEDIGKITKPIVWKLADEWLYSGAEHYHYTADSYERCKNGYELTNRPEHETGFDINRDTWLRKYKSWDISNFTLISPSQWLANRAANSRLFSNANIHVIPNAIDIKFWNSDNRHLSRKCLGLSSDDFVISFGSLGSFNDSRKGLDLIPKIMNLVWGKLMSLQPKILPRLKIISFGSFELSFHPSIATHHSYKGMVNDDKFLRDIYKASDCYLLPSRFDNFPNTAVEAQSCGTPVFAFRVGGLPDIVNDYFSGYLFEPYAIEVFAEKLIYFILNANERNKLLDNLSTYSEFKFCPQKSAHEYSKIYHHITS